MSSSIQPLVNTFGPDGTSNSASDRTVGDIESQGGEGAYSQGKKMRRQPSKVEKDATKHVESQLPSFLRLPDHEKRDSVDLQDAHAKLERRLGLKNMFIVFIAEFVGTLIFLIMAFGVATQASMRQAELKDQAPNAPLDTEGLLFSSLGFGFGLAINAWIFFRISGGLFNPALAFALFLTGALDLPRFLICTVAEYSGAIAAAALVNAVLPGGLQASTALANGTTVGQGFVIEFVMTCQLIFAVFMLAGEKHKGTFLAPIGIGLSLLLAELFATRFTGGSLNPARTLGPDVITGSWEGSCWIYYAATYASALATSAFYIFLKVARYESVVPDQDAHDAIEQKQVVRDGEGNVIAAIDNMPVNEFEGVTIERPEPIVGSSGDAPYVDGQYTSRDDATSPSGKAPSIRYADSLATIGGRNGRKDSNP